MEKNVTSNIEQNNQISNSNKLNKIVSKENASLSVPLPNNNNNFLSFIIK